MPKEIIILKKENDQEGKTLETWGSLTMICKEHENFPYHTIKVFKYPFKYDGFEFHKVKYNCKH